MNNYKVLVLLKPGAEVQPAIERASDCARFMPDVEVAACRIINEYDEITKPSLENQAHQELLAIAKAHPSIKHFTPRVIFSKNVPEAFVKEAHDGKYQLAIISANKRNTIRDLFASTIDFSIMRKIEVPLLVVKNVDATQKLGRAILLAIDFEEEAHQTALDDVLFYSAKVFADEFNGELHVVNCVSPLHRGLISGNTSMPPVFRNTVGEVSRKDMHDKLLQEYATKHNIPLEHTHVVIGRVDEEIPRLCAKLDARMVCMGTSNRNGLLASINSSASELVLEQIKGDLFIVNDVQKTIEAEKARLESNK